MACTIENLILDYQKRKKILGFLDVNLWIGPSLEKCQFENPDISDLKRCITKDLILGGVVSHSAGYFYDAFVGNNMLLDAIDANQFWAGITITPDFFFDTKKGNVYLSEMIKRGARLARAFPKNGNYNFRPWCVQKMVAGLIDHNLPLLIWQTEIDWDDIDAVCTAYPELILIIEGNPQKILYHNRRFYPLLEKHKNLMLELHNIIGYLAVEDIVSRFGPEKLIFGSFLPFWDPNVAIMAVTHARIVDDHKKIIAHGNLKKLIENVQN